MSAVERRFDGISAIGTKFVPESNNYQVIDGATAQIISDEIGKLAKLGRTDRWRTAISEWQQMIMDNPDNLRWALVQGGIYAGYAAE